MPGPKAPDDTTVRLRVDAAGIIVAVNAAFDRFAADNGAPSPAFTAATPPISGG